MNDTGMIPVSVLREFPRKKGHAKITNCYIHKETDVIVCLYVSTSEAVEVEALGSGNHPCVIVRDTNDLASSIEFSSYGNEWNVWSATAEKSGVCVTLVKENK